MLVARHRQRRVDLRVLVAGRDEHPVDADLVGEVAHHLDHVADLGLLEDRRVRRDAEAAFARRLDRVDRDVPEARVVADVVVDLAHPVEVDDEAQAVRRLEPVEALLEPQRVRAQLDRLAELEDLRRRPRRSPCRRAARRRRSRRPAPGTGRPRRCTPRPTGARGSTRTRGSSRSRCTRCCTRGSAPSSARADSARPCAAARRRTCRSRPSMRAGTSSSQPFSHSSECQQRERDAVEVIANHEIERESCAGEVLLVPVAVGALRRTEIVCRPAGRSESSAFPAATYASSAHAVCDAVVKFARPRHAGSA